MKMTEKAPFLLTPGPLTISSATKQAMLRDWGSRDAAFTVLTRRIRERITAIAGAEGTHSCVPIQGSGTYALEAAIGTLVPVSGKLLVLINGAYGHRIARICTRIGRTHSIYETGENECPDPGSVDMHLADDPAITHVAIVHCETTSGILNPIDEIAAVVARHRRGLLIDAMSSFGAISVATEKVPCDAIVSSANKCLEGAPGIGFVIARTNALAESAGNAPSLSLDLYDQWQGFENNGEWRFTPPTHVVAALDQALAEHAAEGSVDGRGARYSENCRRLIDGMRGLGFVTYLPDPLQAPIIVTFLMPADRRFEFARFYDALASSGYLIYPGKLTKVDSFRIGCIGHIGPTVIEGVLAAVRDALAEMGATELGPRAA